MPARRYAFITAWESIWHVPVDRCDGALRKLCGALNPGGVLIWTMGGLDGPEEKRDSAMGPSVYYSVLGITKTLQTVAEAGCVCRHLVYGQWSEKPVFIIGQKGGSMGCWG